MKKLMLLALAIGLMSFAHKFYVSIYRVDHAASKQRLEITARIFVDDLNSALQNKYGRKTMFGENEPADDVELLKKYMSAHFIVRVNGKNRPLEYLSREYESNVIICYFRVTGIDKIKSLEIKNSALTDYVTDQQNIIQTAVNGQKQSAVLTADNPILKIDY